LLTNLTFNVYRRRQWIPTFATEDGENDNAAFQAPKDLAKLTFSSNDEAQPQGLMSFEDLDESHQRKQLLLSNAPLGGSLWDEAETSSAAMKRASSEFVFKNTQPPAVRVASGKSEELSSIGQKRLSSIPPKIQPRSTSSSHMLNQGEEEGVSRVVPKDVSTGSSTPVALAPAIKSANLQSTAHPSGPPFVVVGTGVGADKTPTPIGNGLVEENSAVAESNNLRAETGHAQTTAARAPQAAAIG
jgi:hypothetical protein